MRQTDEQAGRWNDGRMDKHPEGRGEKKNTDGDEDLRERASEGEGTRIYSISP